MEARRGRSPSESSSAGTGEPEVTLSSISEVDTVYWCDDENDPPTVRSVVDHVRLIHEVEIFYPIILGYDG